MRSKILFFFFTIIFLLLLWPTTKVFADATWTCSLSSDPADVTTETKPLKIIIDTGGNARADQDYRFVFMDVGIWTYVDGPANIRPSNGKITTDLPNGWRAGDSQWNLVETGNAGLLQGNVKCKNALILSVAKAQEVGKDYCSIKFLNTQPKPNEDIKIQVQFKTSDFRGGDNQTHAVMVFQNGSTISKDRTPTSAQLESSSGYSLKNQNNTQGFEGESNYRVRVYKTDCTEGVECLGSGAEGYSCENSFYVSPTGGSAGGTDCTNDPSICKGIQVCNQDADNPDKYSCQDLQSTFKNPFTKLVARQMSPCGKIESNANGRYCASIVSFLGKNSQIPTDAAGLISKLLQITLAISGVVALIFIIVSGYRFMLSQGNPEAVQEARESLTSAIVGLLFIIFALVILQLITVNILHIPGFKP